MTKKNIVSVIEAILLKIELEIDNASTQEKAIQFASYYGLFAACNFAPIYDGGHIEEKFLSHFRSDLPLPRATPSKECIHVISRSYQAGGHTRLMERLAGMHKNLPDLLIACESNVDYNQKGAPPLFNSIFDISKVSSNGRFQALLSIFSDYRKIILHIHSDDFITAIAARLVKKNGITKIYFVNHADHLFSFGRSAADCVLEVSAFGEALGRARCPGLNSSFIGIPLPADWDSIDFQSQSSVRKSILTSGSFWKFKPKLGFSLPAIMRNTLGSCSDIELTVLGVRPFRDYWWWTLKILYPARVELRRSVSFLEYKTLLNAHSFVLDSFPIIGGTAFPEAIINGKIALGINSPVSGYSPADQLREVGGQAIKVALFDESAYKERLRKILKEMELVHGVEYVKERYLSSLAGHRNNNLLTATFQGDPFFFEKCASEFGRVSLPSSLRRKSIAEMSLELSIFLTFARYFSFGSLLKAIFNILQLCFAIFKKPMTREELRV
ncbi:hypothetical protein [Acidovorax sp. SRB_14]|uniref:hypothetical protein n=1 Tax=Acidovorax sp. SRB_14 TaxID=1962699 RepID=UPI001566C2FA|nr:hypothetical protein [Acidovorax sp. SRB_14]